ncbi:MAG: hypothetical protein OXE50_02160 [Chloroflexi bacterium]|nr:hypothetical protein [Chloroflexota bacterium]
MATISNAAVLRFGLPAPARWPSPPTHASLWQNGVYRASTPLTSPPARVDSGFIVEIAPGGLVVTIPPGEFTEDAAVAAAVGIFTSDYQVRLHSGDPGETGTANTIEAAGYEHVGLSIRALNFTR